MLARAYLDQLERSNGLSDSRLASMRQDLSEAESAAGAARRDALTSLVAEIESAADGSPAAAKVRTLANAVRDLAAAV